MSNGFKYIRILFITVVLAVCGDSGPVEAGLWDVIKEWYASFRLGEVDEARIPETPVEHVGEVGLNFLGTVELAFDEDTPGIGRVYWMGFSPEGTLLLTDVVSMEAHEFSSTDGQYIRAFGRKGQGPGEYGFARNMAVDPQSRVYLLDFVWGRILRYDRQGQYLNQMRSFHTSRILTGRGGEVFVLKSNQMKIMELQRLDPETWEVVYRTPLSTDKQRFITRRMPLFSQICYSNKTHRLYFLGPNDYLVKEINAETGEVVRQFGHRPKGFVPLPTRYHGITRGTRKDRDELEMTHLKSMTLIQDRYLMVSHESPYPTRWVIYDLTLSTGIEAYDFNSAAKERLEALHAGIPWNSIAAWQDRLYIWTEPSPEVAETANGTVETYELSFDTD